MKIEIVDINVIEPIFSSEVNPVCVCFAVNDKYAKPLHIVIFPMLKFFDKTRYLDVLILNKDISENNKKSLEALSDQNERIS